MLYEDLYSCVYLSPTRFPGPHCRRSTTRWCHRLQTAQERGGSRQCVQSRRHVARVAEVPDACIRAVAQLRLWWAARCVALDALHAMLGRDSRRETQRRLDKPTG